MHISSHLSFVLPLPQVKDKGEGGQWTTRFQNKFRWGEKLGVMRATNSPAWHCASWCSICYSFGKQKQLGASLHALVRPHLVLPPCLSCAEGRVIFCLKTDGCWSPGLCCFWGKGEQLGTHMLRLWDSLTSADFPVDQLRLSCGLWLWFSLCSFTFLFGGWLCVHTLIRTSVLEITHVDLLDHVNCDFMFWSKLKVLIKWN